MRNPRYRVTKDGMFLIRVKDEKKIPIPSPIKLRNYGGLRTQLDVGQGSTIQAISRSVIDESEFSLGDPAASKNGKPVKNTAAPRKPQRKSVPIVKDNGDLHFAYEFYGKKVAGLEEQLLQVKQMMNRLAYDMQQPLPYPEQ